MRQLTNRQKKLLDKVIVDKNITSYDDLSLETIEELEAINNTEILYQEVNRFIGDKRMKEIYG